MTEREEQLERSLSAATLALRAIANYGDCDYEFEPEPTRPRPCPCPMHTAKRALATETTWRFRGARPERLQGDSPTAIRERAIVAAWQNWLSISGADLMLAQILGSADDDLRGYAAPSIRDWFVATTIVQWLVTNVGECILDKAGYRQVKPVLAVECK